MKRKKENFPGARGMGYKMEPTSPEEPGGEEGGDTGPGHGCQ